MTGDLAVRARHILTTYCGHCHGEKDAAGRLNVFDHKAATAHAQPAPFAAKDRALIVEFVKDGSMPLGDHPRPTAAEIAVLEKWVQADAPEYPKRFDDAGAAAAVLADLRTVKPEVVKYTRYVSFAHLLTSVTASDLNAKLTALAGAEAKLRAATKPDAEGELRMAVKPAGAAKSLVPVDAAATVFRFDLRDVEWHHTGLFKPQADVNDTYPMIPFDLFWLENPHALAPGDTAAGAKDWITGPKGMNPHHPTPNPFRPQLFLRGDWLAGQLFDGDTPTPLAEELKALAVLAPVKDDGAKRKALKGPMPRPFTKEKSVPPAPSSSWYVRDGPPPAGAPALTVEVTGKDRKPLLANIPAGRDIHITAKASVAASVAMVEVPSPPKTTLQWFVTSVLLDGDAELVAEKPRDLSPNVEGTIALDAAGTIHYLVFVGDKNDVKPVIVRSAHENAKYPICRIFPPDPAAKVIRRVVPLTVVDE